MQIKKLLPLLLLLIIPIVSAYNGYFGSPSDYLSNEWVMFTLIFVFALGIIYFSSLRTFNDNRGITMIISTGLALFISIALTKKAQLYSFTGEGVGDWIIIIAFIIAIIALFRFLHQKLPRAWWVLGIIIVFLLSIYTDAYELLPESLRYGPVGDFIEAIQNFSTIAIIALIVIGILWFFKSLRKKKNPQQNFNVNFNQPSAPDYRQIRAQRNKLAQQIRASRKRARQEVQPRNQRIVNPPKKSFFGRKTYRLK